MSVMKPGFVRLAAALLFALGPAPAIAAPPDRSLEMLVEITDFTGLSMSPNGRYGVYRAERASVENNDYSSAWFAFRLGRDEPPRRIADGGAPLFSAGWPLGEWPRWAGDASSIYFRALIDGEVQVWRAALDGEARRITGDPADIRAFALLSGDVLAYETGPARAVQPAGPATPNSRKPRRAIRLMR